MKHLGDITRISGHEAPAVDVVIGGSPCQGLSVAGKGLGLQDDRSALFLEQIRVIKEMREADAGTGRTGQLVRPRFMVWENVPGSFSSNHREDFRCVLEETIRIAEPDAPDIPLPRKWPLADAYYGDGWSVAYRVLDEQFWGVPQRRRRIALVADFGGYAAPEILFVRKSVCGDIAAGGATGEEAAAGTGSGAEKAGVICLNDQGGNVMGTSVDVSGTLRAQEHGHQPVVHDARGNGGGKTVCTLTGDHANRVTDYTAIVAHTLRASGHDPQREDAATYVVQAVDCRNLTARRLTPLECERLQGYPDGWTDIGPWVDSKGKRHRESSDSARYRALGNSIALPPWAWVLKRLCACYEHPATMASLFDGIGGFSLLWERLNGPGTCLWASEIDEFPMAVTKVRFGT